MDDLHWESVVVDEDEVEDDFYVLVEANDDVDEDYVLTDSTIDATTPTPVSTTEDDSMEILDSLNVAPKGSSSAAIGSIDAICECDDDDDMVAFLGSKKLKAIFVSILIVSTLLVEAVDMICGITSPPVPAVSRTECEAASEFWESQRSRVAPPSDEIEAQFSNDSLSWLDFSLENLDWRGLTEISFDILPIRDEIDAQFSNDSLSWLDFSLDNVYWKDFSDFSGIEKSDSPSAQYGSLTVWEARYQVHDIQPHAASLENAPMIPMVRYGGRNVESTRSIAVYPTMYPALNGPKTDESIPSSRRLIPCPAPEVLVPSEIPSQKLMAMYHPELYPRRFPVDEGTVPFESVMYPKKVEEHRGSVALTQYTFQDFIRQQENVLVTFYLPCERFHQKYVPLWTNFTKAVLDANLPLVTATVNCHSHPSICREQGCYKFPTIRWFRKGEILVEDYSSGRNAHKLFLFAQRMLMEQENKTEVLETVTFPTIQILSVQPPTSHLSYADDAKLQFIPTLAFVKKQQRTPAISTKATEYNSVSLHLSPPTSSPCPIQTGATSISIPSHDQTGTPAFYRHVEF